MTTKRIVWPQPNGTVWIIRPVPASQVAGEAEEDWLNRLLLSTVRKRLVARVQSDGTPIPDESPATIAAHQLACRIVEAASLPDPAKRWRAAWRYAGNGVVRVDLAAARQMRRAEILAQRERAYERLQRRLWAAEEDGQALRVQALRDKRKQLRQLDTTLDGQLDQVTDLATLDTWRPAILTDPDTA